VKEVIFKRNCEKSIARVSIQEVAREPGKFNNKHFEIIRFFHGGFEKSAIYSRQSSFNESRAIWLNFSEFDSLYRIDSTEIGFDYAKLDDFSSYHIRIVGIFDSADRGHLDQYAGTLKNICLFAVSK